MNPIKALLMLVGTITLQATPVLSEPTMTKAIPSSICEIAKAKNKFSGKIVSVEGAVFKIEDQNKLYLTDSRCPDAQFALRFSAPDGGGDNFKELYDYLYYGKSNEAIGKVIHCKCTGRIRYVRQKLLGYMVSVPIIEVEKVEKAWLSD